MVYAIEIFAMLPGIIEAFASDLGELAAAVEPGLGEGVDIVGVHAPVR